MAPKPPPSHYKPRADGGFRRALTYLTISAREDMLFLRCRLAQLAERLTLDQKVLGSSPRSAANLQYRTYL
jgi:hypothetical protein